MGYKWGPELFDFAQPSEADRKAATRLAVQEAIKEALLNYQGAPSLIAYVTDLSQKEQIIENEFADYASQLELMAMYLYESKLIAQDKYEDIQERLHLRHASDNTDHI